MWRAGGILPCHFCSFSFSAKDITNIICLHLGLAPLVAQLAHKPDCILYSFTYLGHKTIKTCLRGGKSLDLLYAFQVCVYIYKNHVNGKSMQISVQVRQTCLYMTS